MYHTWYMPILWNTLRQPWNSERHLETTWDIMRHQETSLDNLRHFSVLKWNLRLSSIVSLLPQLPGLCSDAQREGEHVWHPAEHWEAAAFTALCALEPAGLENWAVLCATHRTGLLFVYLLVCFCKVHARCSVPPIGKVYLFFFVCLFVCFLEVSTHA